MVTRVDSIKDELADIQDVIHFYDSRGDGKVNLNQVGYCLRSLGLCPTEAQINQLTQHWTDKNVRLSVEEFIPIYRELRKDPKAQDKSVDQLVETLDNFDREGGGRINGIDLRYVLCNCGEALSPEECEILMHGKEVDDGKVNIGDFVNFITS